MRRCIDALFVFLALAALLCFRVLKAGQHYKVGLELEMPTSYTNRRVGVFMVSPRAPHPELEPATYGPHDILLLEFLSSALKHACVCYVSRSLLDTEGRKVLNYHHQPSMLTVCHRSSRLVISSRFYHQSSRGYRAEPFSSKVHWPFPLSLIAAFVLVVFSAACDILFYFTLLYFTLLYFTAVSNENRTGRRLPEIDSPPSPSIIENTPCSIRQATPYPFL